MEKDPLIDFPTLEESIKAIQKLEKYKFPKFKESDNQNINEFKKNVLAPIEKEFKAYPHLLQPKKCNEFNLNLFRVRDLSTFTNPDIFLEHSHPPSHMTKMGRCNFPKTPVFYCSNDPGTSLFEVIRDNDFEKKQFCISRWKVKPTEEILFFENFLRSPLPKENTFKEMNSTLVEKLDQIFEKKLSLDKREGLIKYLEYLDNCFISDDSYSLSATIAHNSLFRDHDTRTDILMYPSRQSNLKSVNLAINPNFVNNNMFVDRFYVVEVNNLSVDKSTYNLTFMQYGTVVNRLTYWRKIIEKDDLFEEYVISDFGRSFYNQIDPLKNIRQNNKL
ncbi:RES domain-containing protein [Zobellia sp. 1_MG-2023]|uniref:RES domain-containing protein n=1 Tax=Zobellia sp. 1_MG-2023 TaxID=3062626 RepID=UPI0026E20B9E|nr:RES domain-containing protein [Zobellia sp. 1_MG-2023]MDO6819444.1 RES domain-containing protein [Zobellia sp. 1_MG-2023]